MGTSAEIIISNNQETKSFHVSFGSHEDDLGCEIQELLHNTNGNNWTNELIQKLKNQDRFNLLSETRPVNYIYLINQNKQLLYKNESDWEYID